MNIKNNTGFMLIEALISIAIVGMLLIPLFGLQSKISERVRQRSHEIDRILYINMITYDARKDQTPIQTTQTITQQKSDPTTTITYQLEPIKQESSLFPIKNLYCEKITLQWNEFGKIKTEQFAHIVYRPESEVK